MGKPLFNWEKIPLSKNLDHKKISIDIDGKSFEDGFCAVSYTHLTLPTTSSV